MDQTNSGAAKANVLTKKLFEEGLKASLASVTNRSKRLLIPIQVVDENGNGVEAGFVNPKDQAAQSQWANQTIAAEGGVLIRPVSSATAGERLYNEVITKYFPQGLKANNEINQISQEAFGQLIKDLENHFQNNEQDQATGNVNHDIYSSCRSAKKQPDKTAQEYVDGFIGPQELVAGSAVVRQKNAQIDVWLINNDTNKETTIFQGDAQTVNGEQSYNTKQIVVVKDGTPFRAVALDYAKSNFKNADGSDIDWEKVTNIGLTSLLKIQNEPKEPAKQVADPSGKIVDSRRETRETLV